MLGSGRINDPYSIREFLKNYPISIPPIYENWLRQNLSTGFPRTLFSYPYMIPVFVVNPQDTLNIQNIHLIDRIDEITTIGKIGSMPSNPNLIRNGDFIQNNFDEWINGNCTLEQYHITGSNYVTAVRFPLVGTSLAQFINPYVGSDVIISFEAISQNNVEQLNCVITYSDRTNETLSQVIANTYYQTYTFQPTNHKRISTIQFVYYANNGYIIMAKIVALADVQTVLPKARNRTTLSPWQTATNATNTVYTVTAAKTFYLCGAHLSVAGTGGGAMFIDGTNRLNVTVAAQAVMCPLTLAVPLPLAAGTVISVYSGAAGVVSSVGIWGWEE